MVPVMQLVRCYREGGSQVYVLLSQSHVRDMGRGRYTYDHWLDIFNAIASGPADPVINSFEVATCPVPGVPVFQFNT